MISRKRIEQIRSIADKDIDTTDIPEASEGYFRKAKLRSPMTPRGRLDERWWLDTCRGLSIAAQSVFWIGLVIGGLYLLWQLLLIA